MYYSKSLSTKIVGVTSLLMLFFSVIMISFLLEKEKQKIIDDTYAEIDLLARLQASEITSDIELFVEISLQQAQYYEQAIKNKIVTREGSDQYLENIVTTDELAASSWVTISNDKFDGLNYKYKNTGRYGRSGNYSGWYHQFLSDTTRLEPLPNFEEEEWYNVFTATRGPSLSVATYAPTGRDQMFLISTGCPVQIDNEIIGYTGLEFSQDKINTTISNISFFESDFASLISQKGYIVVHPDPTKEGTKLDSAYFYNTVSELNAGNVIRKAQYSDHLKEDAIHFLEEVKIDKCNTSWYLVVTVPQTHIDNAVIAYRNRLVVLFGIATFFSILIVFIVTLVILRPVKRIAQNINKLALGNLKNIQEEKVKSNNEIGSLANSYNELVKSLYEKQKIEREQKKLHEDIATSEKRLNLVLNSSNIGLWDYDIENNEVYNTPLCFSQLGYKPTEDAVIGGFSNLDGFVFEDDVETTQYKYKQCIEAGEDNYNNELRLKCKDGHYKWIHSIGGVTERDESGRATRMVGVRIDISNTKQQEKELMHMSDVLNMAQSIAGVGHFEWFIREKRMVGSEALDDILQAPFGYELTPMAFLNYIHPKDRTGFISAFKQALRKKITFHYDLRIVDGANIKQVSFQGHFAFNDDGTTEYMIGTLQDVTENKKLQNNLKQSKDQMDFAAKAANFGLWDWRPQTNELFTNDIFETMLGYEVGTFENRVEKWEALVHPDDLSIIKKAINNKLEPGQDAYSCEFRMKCKDGSWRWMQDFGNVSELDEEGNIQRFMGFQIDIDKNKRINESLISEKQQAEIANKEKSAFLATMSHEIRTPMNAIIGFSEILNKKVNDPVLKEFVNSIRISGKNLLSLINSILDFSKIEANKFELSLAKCDTNVIFEELQTVYKFRAEEKGLTFKVKKPKMATASLMLDELRLKQVLNNLLSNALKFTEIGGLTLSVDCTVNDNNTAKLFFCVEDTGVGVLPQEKQRIFEAFSQQENQDNRKYEGTGLGLSISNSLVHLMGGQIELESEYGKGSRFFFTLNNIPIADGVNVESNNVVSNEITGNEPIDCQFEEVAEESNVSADNEVLAKLLHQNCNKLLESIKTKKTSKNVKELATKLVSMASKEDLDSIQHLGNELLTAVNTFNVEVRETIIQRIVRVYDSYIGKMQ